MALRFRLISLSKTLSKQSRLRNALDSAMTAYTDWVESWALIPDPAEATEAARHLPEEWYEAMVLLTDAFQQFQEETGESIHPLSCATIPVVAARAPRCRA